MFQLAGIGDERCYWIGLSDRDEEGEFVWTDGSKASFVSWLKGTPCDEYAGPPAVSLAKRKLRHLIYSDLSKGYQHMLH